MLATEYTEEETAKLLRVSPRFLRGERAAGRITYAQLGRRILYPESCVRQYQEGQLTRCAKPVNGTTLGKLAHVKSIGRRVLAITR
jgi:hypothetical protein